MFDAHILIAVPSETERGRWRWHCSCKESSKDSYPNKNKALDGGWVHKALVALR